MPMRNLHIGPILAAMRRNRFGALLIFTQIALVLAFIVNAFTLIEHRIEWSARPSGVDEARLFAVNVDLLASRKDMAARVDADVEALRAIDGVEDVYVTNDYPFANSGWAQSVHVKPNQTFSSARTSSYFADTHTLNTLGVRLIAGRNFEPGEVIPRNGQELRIAGSIMVTKSLADALFPGEDALGRSIYVEDDTTPQRIVGIIQELQGPFPAASGRTSAFIENSILVPYRDVTGTGGYLVRADPQRLTAIIKEAEGKLAALDPDRTVEAISLIEARERAHRGDRGLVLLLGCTCAALLMVSAFGIVGLTSFWVAQRRRQIGIRRALGATRRDIVHYFQTENLIISTAGALAGIGLAIGLNIWMVRSFEMSRMDITRAIAGALVVLVLGQVAVFWPAVRAAMVSPALAVRSN